MAMDAREGGSDAPPLIETRGLTKRYGKVRALEDLTIEVRPGEVYGLLGPNGSGKTTCIRLLLGFLRPTSGEARVAGSDCWRGSLEVRRRVGYLPGELRLYGGMTGLEFLRFGIGMRGGEGLDRAVALGERVMKLALKRKVRNYSTGMKQKLALALAFSEPVDVLILDEPTSALDPSAREIVLGLVGEAKRAGQTVIFSGHVLSEVERVADRVAIMKLGRLMHVEDMHARRTRLRLVLARYAGEIPEPPEALGLRERSRENEVVLYEHQGAAAELLGWLSAREVVDVAIGTEDLKSLYDRYHGPDVVENGEKEPGR